jgi:hypothetical protein
MIEQSNVRSGPAARDFHTKYKQFHSDSDGVAIGHQLSTPAHRRPMNT